MSPRKSQMSSFALLLSVVLLVSSSHAVQERLASGQVLSLNQTIVSPGGVFALGFFSPGRSTTANRYYLGVWYNSIRGRTVVWVANRGNPLWDASGVLTLSGDGNLAVLDGEARILWSSNVTDVPSDATAVLMDSGNLVLVAGQNSSRSILWQSFDHPTDTLLPTMKLRLNPKLGINTRMVAWKSAEDPSAGEFSLSMDPDAAMQVRIWRGTKTWMHGRIWAGGLVGEAERVNTMPTVYVPIADSNGDEIDYFFSVTEGSGLMRWVLQPDGHLSRLLWSQSSEKWTVLESYPSGSCSFYGRCGRNGLCEGNGSCSCIAGFVPGNKKAWLGGDFSGGCIRAAPLGCGAGDGFLRVEAIKVPDRFRVVRNVTAARCEEECRSNCSCTAYSFANITSYRSSTRCLVWDGELLDLRRKDKGPNAELNVKLASSELQAIGTKQRGSSRNKYYLVAILVFTLSAVLLLLATLGFYLRKRFEGQGLFMDRAPARAGVRAPAGMGKRKSRRMVLSNDPKFSSILGSGDNFGEPLLLDFDCVVAATDNFSAANKLGQGGFGPVYKGRLQGEEVAIKRLSKCSGQGFEEFRNEVELIARLQHQNIVRLFGWCVHEDEKILIYEYLPNRSLDKFIFEPSRSGELDWGKRFHIIEGIAHGLLYLHQHSRLHVVHRDLKTSNILLDGALNPKISDFGLARMIITNQKEATTERIVGTYGYMSPEYALNGLFSEKSDVFSFGVILLEIISGKRSTGFYPYKESLNLLGYAWHLWEEKRCLELVDPVILESCIPSEVEKCIQAGLLCIQENLDSRPTISSVVHMLCKEDGSFRSPKEPAFATGRNLGGLTQISHVPP